MWTKKELIEKRARFWVVIAGGSALQAACDAVGVNRRTGVASGSRSPMGSCLAIARARVGVESTVSS